MTENQDKPAFTDGVIAVQSDVGDSIRATLNIESGWTSDDPELLAILNGSFPWLNNPLIDYSPVNPNPMLDLMQEAVSLLGGEIVLEPESTAPEGTVF